jgi:hypothetical protein
MTLHVKSGVARRFWTSPLHDGDPGSPVTGSATIALRIWRNSDGLWFDFNDSTFKAYGSVTTLEAAMTEFQATGAPGVYYYDWTPPADADEVYVGYVRDTAGTAKNVPQVEEMYVGGWADQVDDIDTRLPTDPADESLQQASHTQTQADIAALNDLSQADVQAAMTSQGYTTTRAPYLDELAAANLPADVDTLLSRLTALRAAALDEITAARMAELDAANMPADLDAVLADTAAIDGRLPSDPADESLQQASHATTQAAIAALNDLSQADVQSALTAQGYTSVRAALLDNLDASISSVVAAIGALNDISQADVQTAMDSQGYTSARAAMIELSKKMLINRLELDTGGSSANWTLYDDDDSTPLLTFDVSDHLGGVLSLQAGQPARRTRGT